MGYAKKAQRYIASGKRKYARANAWSKTPQTPRDLAIQAYNGVKYLKGLVNSEMLHTDTTLSLGANQSQVFALCQITQNDTDTGRTGNSILLKSIYIRGVIEINTAVTANSRVMICLIKDTQQIADTTPSVTDVFKSPSPESMLNLNASGRFKVMFRKTYTLSPAAGGRNVIEFTKYWKTQTHIRYNSVASTDIQKGGYYLVVISSEVANFPNVSLQSRVGYHDN